MTKQLMTFRERRQDAKYQTIAGIFIFTLGLALFIMPIVLLANQL